MQASGSSVHELLSHSVEKLQVLQSRSGLNEIGPEADESSWLQDVIEHSGRGDPSAKFSLGQYYFTKGDFPRALEYYNSAADSGSAQAIYQLAVMNYDGTGMPSNPEKGFSFMVKIADLNNCEEAGVRASAQFNVGRAYFQGFGIQQSDEEAIAWWMKAARGGSNPAAVRAMNTLAMFYSRPDSYDLHKMFSWHLKAAENGHLESMAALGLLYIKGQGCAKNDREAMRWFKSSAEGGSVYGTGVLSYYYYCKKFFTKAVETALKITEIKDDIGHVAEECDSLPGLVAKGMAIACFILGRCLHLGQAVTKDEQRAMTYFEKAKKLDRQIVAELHTQMLHGHL